MLPLAPPASLLLLSLLLLSRPALGQFRVGTGSYEQMSEDGLLALTEELHSHSDVKANFYPEKLFQNIDVYRMSIPLSQDYTVGIMVNPCGDYSQLPYDCCVNKFGDGEYGLLTDEIVAAYGLKYPAFREGRSDTPMRAGEDAVFETINLINDRGAAMTLETSRRADDELIVANECLGRINPYPYCMGVRLRKKKYFQMAACTDNNETVNALDSCFDIEGEAHPNCMQVSYTQSAFLHVCGGEFADNDHCGTFLEVHRLSGSPFFPEDTVLSSRKIETVETSGMMTTTVPLTVLEDTKRILCEFREAVVRVGVMVLIKENAPVCCCPSVYSTLNRKGRKVCPNKPGTAGGPFADSFDSLEEKLLQDSIQGEYPFCPQMDENEDLMLCSRDTDSGFFSMDAWSEKDGKFKTGQSRFYATECEPLTRGNGTDDKWTSSDLSEGGEYSDVCPYFDSCGLSESTLATLSPGESLCKNSEEAYRFAGYIGKIVEVPKNLADPDGIYKVSFNDGRTSYGFVLASLEMQEPDFNYELWYVQRTPYDLVIQQRKPFKVVGPKCTYDFVNSRYFPFAMLDDDMNPLTQSDYGFDGIPEETNYVDSEVFYENNEDRRRQMAEAKMKREEAKNARPKITGKRKPEKVKEKERLERERKLKNKKKNN
jgi:hypothetical protein